MSDAHLSRPRSFRIEHNGAEWTGSFQSVVRKAIEDVIQDGPIAMTLLLDEDHHTYRSDVTVAAIDSSRLYVLDGEPIDWPERLLGIEVR